MQHIALNLVDEKGKLIERSIVNFADIMFVLFGLENYEKKFPWLSKIDPYGYTYCNIYQTPIVIKELENLKKEKIAGNLIKEINETIEFLKKIEQGVSAQFIGD